MKAGVVSLHSRSSAAVALSHCAVDHVEASLSLIQLQLELGTAAPREGGVLRAPLNVENAVGRSATYRCEYAIPGVDQKQIAPVREDRVVVTGPRQADVREGGVRSRELGIAVGRQIDRGEGMVVQGEREGEWYGGDAVVTMIAGVHVARHNVSAYLNYCKTCARRWGRRRRKRRRRAGCRCRAWRRQRDIPSSLNPNKRRRAGLKVANGCIGGIWRLIGIKPEVIQSAEANRVGILILRKSFRAPGDRACVLGNSPRCAAISSISLGTIMCKAGMLRRRMKANVRDVYSGSNMHAERLDGAIEVLVVQGIFIVPDSSSGVRYFIAHEPDTVISRVRLNLVYRRTGPSHNRRMLSHGWSSSIKIKGLINSSYGVRAVRSVVIHVALVRMTLAPDAFVRNDVFRFGKVRRSRVQRRVQVINVNQHSVRRYIMTVAAMIVRR